ncbi:MAG TPA: leucyl aminopeptidase, partial [Candidatus Xenobia bacterium]
MQLEIRHDPIEQVDCDGVILGWYQGDKEVPAEWRGLNDKTGGLLGRLVQEGEIRGKFREYHFLHTTPPVAVIGLGEKVKFRADRLRSAVARGARMLRRHGARHVAVPSHRHLGLEASTAANCIVEGVVMGLYRFKKYATKEKDQDRPDVFEQLLLSAPAAEAKAVEAGGRRAMVLAEHTNRCRDMVNEPGNRMTPTLLADTAEMWAGQCGAGFEALGPDRMHELGMGALLGVAQGSQEPPRMIVLTWRGGAADGPVLGLVGKGITFDSGGLSLKDAEGMYRMYADMAGAAAVISAVTALARLKVPVNVVGVCAATENMPSGTAYRPGDILRSMEGKTIEILNTDAEGRLALADALAYARKLGATALVDVATLTGACGVALGRIASGLFSSNDRLRDMVLSAADAAGEYFWPLPLFEEYMDLIRSDVADLENTG